MKKNCILLILSVLIMILAFTGCSSEKKMNLTLDVSKENIAKIEARKADSKFFASSGGFVVREGERVVITPSIAKGGEINIKLVTEEGLGVSNINNTGAIGRLQDPENPALNVNVSGNEVQKYEVEPGEYIVTASGVKTADGTVTVTVEKYTPEELPEPPATETVPADVVPETETEPADSEPAPETDPAGTDPVTEDVLADEPAAEEPAPETISEPTEDTADETTYAPAADGQTADEILSEATAVTEETKEENIGKSSTDDSEQIAEEVDPVAEGTDDNAEMTEGAEMTDNAEPSESAESAAQETDTDTTASSNEKTTAAEKKPGVEKMFLN
ncbi:MAG: hypothetical protein IJI14_20810 [Anaerolineaceae bacterium]|nr:hypothetical protein [Anaerolineaceae bacterium]